MTMVERTDYEKWSSVADCTGNGSHITTNKQEMLKKTLKGLFLTKQSQLSFYLCILRPILTRVSYSKVVDLSHFPAKMFENANN